MHQKSLKAAFKTVFSVHNSHLKLCGQVKNSKWILCSRKTCVKCGYILSKKFRDDILTADTQELQSFKLQQRAR